MRNLIIAGILAVVGLCLAGTGPDMEHPVVIDKEVYEHTCIDSTHVECDGACECDGLGCEYNKNK